MKNLEKEELDVLALLRNAEKKLNNLIKKTIFEIRKSENSKSLKKLFLDECAQIKAIFNQIKDKEKDVERLTKELISNFLEIRDLKPNSRLPKENIELLQVDEQEIIKNVKKIKGLIRKVNLRLVDLQKIILREYYGEESKEIYFNHDEKDTITNMLAEFDVIKKKIIALYKLEEKVYEELEEAA
jgi:hypothetical protein